MPEGAPQLRVRIAGEHPAVNITPVKQNPAQLGGNTPPSAPLLKEKAVTIKDLGQRNTLAIAEDVSGPFNVVVHGNDNVVRIAARCRLQQVHITIKASHCTINIGENCTLSGEFICIESDTHLVIGSHTSMMGSKITLHEAGRITIGTDCMFAGAVRMDTSDMHSIVDATTGVRLNPPGDIHIEDHVWLGYGVYVTKAVHIGAHSVIGTGAVVTHDIPANSLAGGIPAKVIRTGVSWDRKRLPYGKTAARTGLSVNNFPAIPPTSDLPQIKDACIKIKNHRLAQEETPSSTLQKIPKRIFQFWDTKEAPKQIKTLLDHNRALCEKNGVEYVLFNEENARIFLESHFPAEVLATFDMAPHPAMKCDLLRLCYLYAHGGVYVDADLALKDIYFVVFEQRCELLAFQWDTPTVTNVCNWLMGATQGSPAILFALQATLNNMHSALTKDPTQALRNILSVSGPGIFTRAIAGWMLENKENTTPIVVLTVDMAHSITQLGPSFLKSHLEYKKTGTQHWLRAITPQS